MADPFTLSAIVIGAITVGGGTGLSFALRGRQRKHFRDVMRAALDVPDHAAAALPIHFPRFLVAQCAVTQCDKPATLHLISRVTSVQALLEIFDPELLTSGGFAHRADNASSNGIALVIVDPEKEPTVARRNGAAEIDRSGESGLIAWTLPALSDDTTPRRARDGLVAALALHEQRRASAGLKNHVACPRCDDSRLDDLGRGPGGTLGCRVCAGLFLTQTGAQAFFDELGLLPGEVSDRQAAQTLTCPGCGHPMTALVQNDTVIDVCSHCGGAWVDGDEAQTFVTTMQ